MRTTDPATNTVLVTESVFRTARSRARAEVTSEILDAARQELTEVGAVALALRAVARRVGMAPSALYRYFASREELLTALIIDAYDGIGACAEASAARTADDPDPTGRWLAVCRAVRDWALAHPHEFTLVYGSPVPGYAAPTDTVGPATRLPHVLAGLLTGAVADGALTPPKRSLPSLVRPEILAAFGRPPAPFGDLVERTIIAWTSLIGTIHFELFGHFRDVIADPDAYFTSAMTVTATLLGLPDSA